MRSVAREPCVLECSVRDDLLKRFMSKVEPEPNTGCWLWSGGCKENRYGEIKHSGTMKYAHRISYILFSGDIPENTYVLHKCDIPECVNPDHLFLGSQRDNVIDSVRKGRARRASGEKCHLSKLKRSDIIAIKSMVGVSTNDMSRMFGVGGNAIRRILGGKTWKDVK